MTSEVTARLVTPDMVAAAEQAFQGAPAADAMRAALEAAFECAIAATQTVWVRGDLIAPLPADEFPVGPFEAWFILRGYEVIPHQLTVDWWKQIYGRVEGGPGGLSLKE